VVAAQAKEQTVKAKRRPSLGVVDCDVHVGLASHGALKPYLDSRWYPYYDQTRSPRVNPVSPKIGSGASRGTSSIFRADAFPEGGGAAGSDMGLLREQLLDRYNVTHAILSPLDTLSWSQYGPSSLAAHQALNDWITAEWLDRDDRLYGSVMIPTEDGLRAAAEVRRVASDRRFVQVLFLAGSTEGLGHPKYWPVYEAAAEHDLPIAVHVGGFAGHMSGAGFLSYYGEHHVSWSHYIQAHLVSLLYNGVFDRFPDLRFILIEGRLTWMPSMMWRLDRAWEGMRDMFPHLRRPPSEVMRERFWFTTQPMDEPEKPEYLLDTLQDMNMNDRIMFATDYPHWDFDAPDRSIPRTIKGELRDAIFSKNALGAYRFPSVAR
jgi:predicted TIM-barrel fold metal-dependent hydrolase